MDVKKFIKLCLMLVGFPLFIIGYFFVGSRLLIYVGLLCWFAANVIMFIEWLNYKKKIFV